ncbi:MAG: carboxymuconolactone decarboxylase family protein [Candidatus Thermoplasmatota archaeon]|nr:carboxymuconolactone decarboxylase family protein [Candidatus Thermoplasmatota archaeon]
MERGINHWQFIFCISVQPVPNFMFHRQVCKKLPIVVRTVSKDLSLFLKSNFMQPRPDYGKFAPEMLRYLRSIEKAISESGIDHGLLHLIKMRASQLNGCGWCLDMHSKDALLDGETVQRIALLSAWWECPQYTDREKAALAWTERVTLISETREDDELYENLKKFFTEEQIVILTWAIIAINSWNRLNVSFKTVPGTYETNKQKAIQ